jgi:hypothetical protein
MKPLIDVRIADEELESLAQGGEPNGRQLVRLLDDELARFEAWMIKELHGGLVPMERAIVKTYLYQKLVGRVDNLDSKPIDLAEMARTG